jgi:hypothetical protein
MTPEGKAIADAIEEAIREAYEDAARIAEEHTWPQSGVSIAAAIRARASEGK